MRSMMTIAICDMKTEDTKSQVLFWIMLSSTYEQHGVENVSF